MLDKGITFLSSFWYGCSLSR